MNIGLRLSLPLCVAHLYPLYPQLLQVGDLYYPLTMVAPPGHADEGVLSVI